MDEIKDNPEIVEEEGFVQPSPPNRPRKVYAGMWGPLEIGAVAAGALTLLLAAVVYIFWVVPSNRELAGNRAEADRLESELASARSRYGEITTTESQVERIVSSIDDFESRFLPVVSTGQGALYQRINGLILAYGLTNTSGPDYAPLEAADQNGSTQSDEDKGRAKFRSLYPGVYVTTTLEGSYQNLRRFIREIETGREFIIVSAVELAPSDTQGQRRDENSAQPTDGQTTLAVPGTNSQPNMKGAQPFGSGPVNLDPRPRREQGKMHGETVSLRIEMAAYFRRPNMPQTAVGQ